MKLRVPHPRLLPVTITALGALLAVKSVELAQFVAGAAIVDTSVVAQALAASAAAEAGQATSEKGSVPAGEPHGKAAAEVPAAAARGSAGAEQAPAALIAHVTPSADPAPPPVGDAERALLQDLRSRKLEIDARDRATSEREAVLSAAEHKLSERVEQLAALQTRLEGLDAERKAHDEANWTGLVRTYEAMKPRDAAAIFNDLDLAVLLPVLDRMKETKAAPVLAAMQPERARLVTAKLAQMRSQPSLVAAGG